VIEEFHRIKRLPPYVFAEVNRLKAAARAAGADIIDLGMGNPDMPTPQHIVDKLVETVAKPRTHRYSASKGIAGLRQAQARYYARRFGVKLNPETQIVATLGSKEGFANMAQAISAPGDVILVPSPTYPIHEFGFIISGAAIRHIPMLPAAPAAGRGLGTMIATVTDWHAAFLRGIERAVRHSIPKPLAVVLNYPSNPTAMTVGLDFLTEVVQLAKKLELIILSDLAYAEIYFEGNPPPSVLQVPGAVDLAVEFTSLSKTYSMPGWRIGFAVGNERLIAALARVKSYLDYGAFTPVQVAAAAALNGSQGCIDEVREIYRSRRDCLVESFARAGWQVPVPAASMFAWAPIPAPFHELGSVAFAKLLVEKADVAVSPGLGFGEYGEGFVRIALVENEQRIRQAARNIKKFLARPPESMHNVIPIAHQASR
jgi:alanine-synthesizing transaminase